MINFTLTLFIVLPLFLGKVEVTNTHFDAAEVDYILPLSPAAENQTSQSLSLKVLKRKIDAIISSLAEYTIPNPGLRVNNASINLFYGERKLLQLTQFDLLLESPPAGRKLTLNCKSDVWQGLSISGLLNTTTSQTTPLATLQVNGSQIDCRLDAAFGTGTVSKASICYNSFRYRERRKSPVDHPENAG